ncbi:TPA: hemagglutinin repeat-containing protein, partial [Serratia marcescens]
MAEAKNAAAGLQPGDEGAAQGAGQNLSITAHGKNHNAQSGDIAITGSQLKAGKDLSLDAARDITLQS